MMDGTTETERTDNEGLRFQETIPIENWDTAEWPAAGAAENTHEDDARAGLRWRRSLVVLTTADADTSAAGA